MGKGDTIRISNGPHQGNAVKRSVYNHFPNGKEEALTLFEQTLSQQSFYVRSLACYALFVHMCRIVLHIKCQLITQEYIKHHSHSVSALCAGDRIKSSVSEVNIEHSSLFEVADREFGEDAAKERERLYTNSHHCSLSLAHPAPLQAIFSLLVLAMLFSPVTVFT